MAAVKKHKLIRIHAFRILMDWYIFAAAMLLLVALCLMIVLLGVYSPLEGAEKLVAISGITLTILYLVDTLFFTYYLLTDDALCVVSQLRHLEFPYRSMREIRPIGIRGLFSFGKRKRFATSLHAHQIILQGERWGSITVSPIARDEFIHQLIDHVDRERNRRVSASKG